MNQIEKVYSVYDAKAEAYTPFFSERTDGLAIRTIENAMANPESNLARHCSDFELHCLGTFDVSSGESERLFWTNEETGEVLPLKPEFCAMSRRPGIGGQWIEDNLEDTYKDDFVVFKGRERAVPRYYDKYMEKLDPWKFDEIKMDRVEKARQLEEDRDRLRVMETVKQLKADKLVRYV